MSAIHRTAFQVKASVTMANNIIHSFSTLAQHDKSRITGKNFLMPLKKTSSICFVLTLIKLNLITPLNYAAHTTFHMKYPPGKKRRPSFKKLLNHVHKFLYS